jgi:hypothetical protein
MKALAVALSTLEKAYERHAGGIRADDRVSRGRGGIFDDRK